MTVRELVRDFIVAHPGATYTQACAGLKKVPSGSISGALSKLTEEGAIKHGDDKPFQYWVGDKPVLERIAPRRRRRKNGHAEAGILISIAVGKNHTETMSINEAKAVYQQLREIFGS